MRSSQVASLSNSARLFARRPTSFSSAKDPLDMTNMVGPDAAAFDFPLTRPTVLKMEKQRKILHYLRLEQLQFKDLVAFRQPFQPPNRSTEVVQVRHQHYQGEDHPASRKVSISVPVSALNLAPKELHKFKLLAGPRYSPAPSSRRPSVLAAGARGRTPEAGKAATEDEGEFKLSCELFPNDKMNEKWCSDTLDKLLAAARDQRDTFEDVALDLRGTAKRLGKSRKAKKTLGLKDFPQEWLRPQQ